MVVMVMVMVAEGLEMAVGIPIRTVLGIMGLILRVLVLVLRVEARSMSISQVSIRVIVRIGIRGMGSMVRAQQSSAPGLMSSPCGSSSAKLGNVSINNDLRLRIFTAKHSLPYFSCS